MGKIIQMEIPDWITEEDIKLLIEILTYLKKEKKYFTIEEIRKFLGIKEIKEDIKIDENDILGLRKKEEERIK